MEPKDRLSKLLDPSNTTLNGIDFVEIASSAQTSLRVHFLNAVALEGTLTAIPTITGGETIPTVTVDPIDASNWSFDTESRPLLTLEVPAPGDFSFYTMSLASPALDPYYSQMRFTFKALCPSDLDCAPPVPPCPPLTGTPPPITYLAKDFLSFRKALSDFSALQYPAWQERSEADFGVMFMEALCSLTDDLSYTQDRIAAEALIDTATQRRSLVRLARLVDYEPQPATASAVLLQFDVTGGPIPSGLLVSASAPDGSAVDFETGTGLIDPTTLLLNTTTYAVSPNWNRCLNGTPNILPYWWDDSQRCLEIAATEMWVQGQGFGFYAGQQLLIDTAALNPVDAPIREVVVLQSVMEQTDSLFGIAVTQLVFEGPIASNHDLTRTLLAGNLVPATQGRRYVESFAIHQAPPGAQMQLAIQRIGPNASQQYLYTLANTPLAWLLQNDPAPAPFPEIVLVQQPQEQALPPLNWMWRSTLMEAQEFEQSYTIDPMNYTRTTRNSDGSVSYDYLNDDGATIRFGDDVFGGIPQSGSVFTVTYRAGGGSVGNVSADTITNVVPTGAGASPGSGLVTTVTNPFAATGGQDEETNEQIARRAPQAFRAVQYRAVTPGDYEAAAETLPWVLRAGTEFRWTGSWLTVFTTADPEGTDSITVDEEVQLVNLLNRYRMAGYESYVPAPDYVSIDLIVTVCACSSAFQGDVESAVLLALSDAVDPDGSRGFFYFDNFTFGTPLERSALEAAIQAAYGVAGVVSIQYRERGVTQGWADLPDPLVFGTNQILRVDNDPNYPERGTLQVIVEGGK
ncbi:MAG: baseplate J/gp47 family protein [Terracidiphilus sp.]